MSLQGGRSPSWSLRTWPGPGHAISLPGVRGPWQDTGLGWGGNQGPSPSWEAWPGGWTLWPRQAEPSHAASLTHLRLGSLLLAGNRSAFLFIRWSFLPASPVLAPKGDGCVCVSNQPWKVLCQSGCPGPGGITGPSWCSPLRPSGADWMREVRAGRCWAWLSQCFLGTCCCQDHKKNPGRSMPAGAEVTGEGLEDGSCQRAAEASGAVESVLVGAQAQCLSVFELKQQAITECLLCASPGNSIKKPDPPLPSYS